MGHTFGTENPYTSKIEEDYKPHPRWGQPKQEGARPLSRYEYYFGPVEQQSTVELANQNLLNNLFIKPVQWFHSILEKLERLQLLGIIEDMNVSLQLTNVISTTKLASGKQTSNWKETETLKPKLFRS